MDRLRRALGGDDDENRLPEHEYKEPDTVGGGVMGAGGTAVDRGTSQMEPSDEDSRAEPGEIAADRDAADAYDPVASVGDLFPGRAENSGIDDADEVDEEQIQGPARPQL
jgi:hypothetical protein